MRKAFSVHSDFYGEIRGLSDRKRGELLLALVEWAEEAGEQSSPLRGKEIAILFRLMTAQVERISLVNSVNGANGGRGVKSEKSGHVFRKRGKASDTESVAVTDTKSVTDTVAEKRGASAKPVCVGKFVPPSVEEVGAYVSEKGFGVMAEEFVCFYEARGWKLTRGAEMVDWRAVVRYWEQREKSRTTGVFDASVVRTTAATGKGRNRFANFDEGEIDFERLERLERERRNERIKGMGDC